MKRSMMRYMAVFLTILLGFPVLAGTGVQSTAAENREAEANAAAAETLKVGGGYAVTGQVKEAGYMAEVFDAANGLPTSDANFILGASDGYVWIGGYSGIIRYDGIHFERMDTSDGLTSGRGLFEDSEGRIWVGTNDNGVVVIDGGVTTHLTYKEGLPSSSIRIFAEDDDGHIYIGTTAGVCFVDSDMAVHLVDDPRLNDERVLRLDTDARGRVYGMTRNGKVFLIEKHKVAALYESSDLEMEQISSLLADPDQEGKVYLCTEDGMIYYGDFGAKAGEMKQISAEPLSRIQWISRDCGRIWVASISQIGYLDENDGFHVVSDLPMGSGIEMMTSDYQGNLWVASSTLGVMKVVADSFVDLSKKVGLPEEVTNTTCLHGDELYIGTDEGLRIINSRNEIIENELTAAVGDARVRCMKEDAEGNLWVATFTGDRGLLCLSGDGRITSFTTENGMPSNEVRCVEPASDGGVLVGTNGGLAVIQNRKVVRTVGEEAGIRNTVFLTVAEGEDGILYAGTDGDGIYVIQGEQIRRIGRDQGLTSDVIMRIKKDEDRGVYWLVTSNSIQYMRNAAIKEVSSFPYNNNYDVFYDNNENLWILSSYGIYMVKADEMLKDRVTDYRLYTMANGVTCTPTSNSYSALDQEGNLYISGRSGVCKVNINHFSEEKVMAKGGISSIYCGDTLILPDEEGTYVLPSSGERIRITAAVLDYTLTNPTVQVFLEGSGDKGITTLRSDLQPLEYTGLEYGDYTLRIRVLDSNQKDLVLDEAFRIEKKPRVMELLLFRLLIVLLAALAAGLLVWRVMKSTVIRKQYDELRQARDEAQRANSVRTRFLANMSYDIRTPINTILGMDELILREDASKVPREYSHSVTNYAHAIRTASETLLGLVNNLMDMSKIESGGIHLTEQEYDIQDLLRPIVALIRPRSTEKELTFNVEVDEMLPTRFYGDDGKIRQILMNLLSNAVKFTEKGGFVLTVSMEERADDTAKLRFSVKDTGIGIKEEDLETIFTAYERMDESNTGSIRGSGLGLDISRRFAELMEGSLTCSSVYGQGSEFVFSLEQKIVDSTPVGIFTEEESLSPGFSGSRFVAPDADILVLDDNPVNLSIIKGLLKDTRIFVTAADDGEECLEKLRTTRFNVILMDHVTRGMDEMETVARIREMDPDLPVYLLTADMTEGEEYFKAKGFNGCLAKPIDGELLERTILRHLPEEIVQRL